MDAPTTWSKNRRHPELHRSACDTWLRSAPVVSPQLRPPSRVCVERTFEFVRHAIDELLRLEHTRTFAPLEHPTRELRQVTHLHRQAQFAAVHQHQLLRRVDLAHAHVFGGVGVELDDDLELFHGFPNAELALK